MYQIFLWDQTTYLLDQFEPLHINKKITYQVFSNKKLGTNNDIFKSTSQTLLFETFVYVLCEEYTGFCHSNSDHLKKMYMHRWNISRRLWLDWSCCLHLIEIIICKFIAFIISCNVPVYSLLFVRLCNKCFQKFSFFLFGIRQFLFSVYIRTTFNNHS